MKPVKSGRGSRVRARGGFTLVEMVVVLAIMVLLTGFFMVRFNETPDEQMLAPIAENLKQMARRAVTEAAAYREDYAILLAPEQLQLVRGQGAGAGAAVALEIESTLPIPPDAVLSARWFGDPEWRPVEGQAWLFRSGGLCEPIEVRLESRRGKAFIELAFDPLTGMAEEQSFYP